MTYQRGLNKATALYKTLPPGTRQLLRRDLMHHVVDREGERGCNILRSKARILISDLGRPRRDRLRKRLRKLDEEQRAFSLQQLVRLGKPLSCLVSVL